MKGAKLLAKDIHMMSIEEVEFLQEVCESVLTPDAHIINIGAGVGTSLLAVQEVLPDATVFSVDIKQTPVAFSNVDKYGGDSSKFIRIIQNSAQVLRLFPFPVDMIFVDGAHDSQSVEKDALHGKPLVRDLGVMFFHDYDHPNLPELSGIVDAIMDDWYCLGKERYLIAFQQ